MRSRAPRKGLSARSSQSRCSHSRKRLPLPASTILASRLVRPRRPHGAVQHAGVVGERREEVEDQPSKGAVLRCLAEQQRVPFTVPGRAHQVGEGAVRRGPLPRTCGVAPAARPAARAQRPVGKGADERVGKAATPTAPHPRAREVAAAPAKRVQRQRPRRAYAARSVVPPPTSSITASSPVVDSSPRPRKYRSALRPSSMGERQLGRAFADRRPERRLRPTNRG